jgi:hypothetical protein
VSVGRRRQWMEIDAGGGDLRDAAQRGVIAEVEVLVASGCDVNAADGKATVGGGEREQENHLIGSDWTGWMDGTAPGLLRQRREDCALPSMCVPM